MLRGTIRALACLTILALGFVNARVAAANWFPGDGAHDWGSWHWDRSTLNILLSGSHQTEAGRAANAWNALTDLTLPSTSRHSNAHISLWGSQYGSTGWTGLTSIEVIGWDWHCWAYCGLRHVHSRYNNSVRPSNSWYVQKVFCHELGHAFGFDHNATGGCMITGYWPRLSNRPSGHDVWDVNARY